MSESRERKVDDRLSDWVDDCLSDRERERFVAELRVSPQLRKDLEEYERTVAAVRAALRAPIASSRDTSSSLADRVMQAIAEPAERRAGSSSTANGLESHRNRFGGPVPRWLPMVGSIAAAAALLAVALWLHSWQTTSQRPEARNDVASVPTMERPASRDQAGATEVAVENEAAAGDEPASKAADKESNDQALRRESAFDSGAWAKAAELGGAAKDGKSEMANLQLLTLDAPTTVSQDSREEAATREIVQSATPAGSANPSVEKSAGFQPLAAGARGGGGALVIPVPGDPALGDPALGDPALGAPVRGDASPDARHYVGPADTVPPSPTRVTSGPGRAGAPATSGPSTSGPGGPATAGPGGARRGGRVGAPSMPATTPLRQLPMVTVTATSSAVLESLQRDDLQSSRSAKRAATGVAADSADADKLTLFFQRQILGRDVATPDAVDVLREQDKDADAVAARKSAPAEGEAKEKAPVREMKVVDPSTFSMATPRQRAIDSGLDVGAGLRIAELVEEERSLSTDPASREKGAAASAEKGDAPATVSPAPEERTWIVEGNRAAVADLLRQLSAFSARAGAQLANGELPLAVPLPWQDRVAVDGTPVPQPGGGRGSAAPGGAPGAKAEFQASQGEVVQIVLRFRVTR
jgi:negative regulator of sigma E activity